MSTVADGIAAATTRLLLAGLSPDDARQSATILAGHALGWDRATLLARWRDATPERFEQRFAPLVARRARHEPVAYITGEREFYSRTFVVTPAVLIPRPETEFVVEEALDCLRAAHGARGAEPHAAATDHDALRIRASTEQGARSTKHDAGPVIIDIGTGSGCLAVTLALEWPAARVIATDVSEAALEVARMNAARLGAAAIEFRHGPFFAGASVPADLVVSNPPYIAEGARASLAPEVVEFEPAGALFSGDDGLTHVAEILVQCTLHLRSAGHLVMEIGMGQADTIAELVGQTEGLELVNIRADLQGIPRVLVIRRTSESV